MLPNIKVSISKRTIDQLEYSENGCNIYFDKSLPGFGIRVHKSCKSYVVQARVGGKALRRTIGKHGHYTAEQARVEAQSLLALMAKGFDPLVVEVENKIKALSLKEVFLDYKSKRELRPSTLLIYEGALRRCFSDWLEVPITSLTRDQIEHRLQEIASANGPRGGGIAQAGQCYRLLRSLIRFVFEQYEVNGKPILESDPTRNLSRGKLWTVKVRRQEVIEKHQLAVWFKAVAMLSNKTASDYLVFCLLTGLRRTEAISLKWSNVNFDGRYITIDSNIAKNHTEHRLPLSYYLHTLLKKRLADNHLASIYVFPGAISGTHLQEPKRMIKNVIQYSGVKFRLHDLRRTFATIAESLDIPHYTLKKLMNHKNSNDVTSGYLAVDVERLRQPMQKITNYILDQGRVNVGVRIHGAKATKKSQGNV